MSIVDNIGQILIHVAGAGVVGLIAAHVVHRRGGRWTWALPPFLLSLLLSTAGLQPNGPHWLLLLPIAIGVCGYALLEWELLDRSKGGRAARRVQEHVGVATVARRSRARVRAGRDETGYVLGADRRRFPVRIPLGLHAGSHQLLLGATGSGKTTTLLATARHHVGAGFACIAVDLKGDRAFAKSLAELARDAGRPFRLFTLDGGAHWNPVAYGGRSELKDKLMGSERFSERHYEAMYERYLQHVFAMVEGGAQPRSLDSAVALLDPDELDRSIRKLESEEQRRLLRRYLDEFGPDQRRHLKGLHDRLAIVLESSAGQYLLASRTPEEDIDLRRAVAGREVICFSLNSSSYPGTAKLVANLIAQDLMSVAGWLERNDQGRTPALVAIDEFSALDADNVVSLFQRGRSAALSLVLATQELADLRRVDPGFADQVMGNVEVLIAGRQNVPDSAELIARAAGTHEVPIHTVQTERPMGLRPGGYRDSGRGSKRLGEEFIVHPNEIKALAVGEAVVVSKNPHRVRVVRVAGD